MRTSTPQTCRGRLSGLLPQALLPLLCILLLTPGASAQPGTGWTLVWADEFSQPDGSAPDTTKWTYDTGGGGWGNKEWQYYTSRTNNARIENGTLVIEALQESYSGSNYTSARLKTQGKASWTYGRMEARIKIPRGQGIWPAFWMLGTNITSVNWPQCGEIDILENIGREPKTVHGTIHGPGYSGANGIGGPYALPDDSDFADDFHIYAVEWTTNSIQWFVDGRQYFSLNPARLPNGAAWVFTTPQFLILNVAVGGNWPGYPDQTTVFPQQMLVDYVRVYAPSPLSACKTNALANPGYESGGLSSWSVYGAGFNTVLETVQNVPPRNGTNVFKVFGQFNGGVNLSGAFQDVPSAPGEILSADAWAFTPGNDRIAGSNSAWVEISFRDPSATVLGLYRTDLITSNTPAGAWLRFPVTTRLDPATSAVIGPVTNLIAPEGTSVARYQVVFRQPAMAAGAVLFDDLKLVRGEPVDVPVTAALTGGSGALDLAFATFLDLPYAVQWTSDLRNPGWMTLTNIAGNGMVRTIRLDDDGGTAFYRVRRICD